ncbi:hypothetical protein [Gillisia limnaea]|uniref:Secretion system C-terminal sorting domain-containing protein n=1 Tax=Gillisia limnaea (strain DSM 15749 / LMG 21470 / R-8282) TaxID=865937 RepID=H2BYL3_GILLR|nr:hypothetical protein [Gillisia limnaea]EHQ01134.1 hypothetical protein Gilli_0420 [Gillisia limnaea DSM 15749]
MKKNYPELSFFFRPGLALVVFLFFSLFTSAQGDLIVNGNHTVPADSLERYDYVELGTNNSILTVNGTLIVDGDLIMAGNKSQFKMGPNARVIIFGNFEASNQVEIAISSFLIIHGNFIKGGSDNQGDLDVENGNIYIYGKVENWGDDFTTCDGGYEGNTNTIQQEDCDYGTEEDFENNRDKFPDDLVDLINCYDLSAIDNQNACLGGSATFSVSGSLNVSEDEVTFRWQQKVSNSAIWTNIPGETNIEYSISEVSAEMEDYNYRVIVKPLDPSQSTCKISISRNVSLSITNVNTWTGTTDTNWNNTANWSCNSLPTIETNVVIPENLTSNNFPVINAGTNALTKNLSIENGASVKVNENWLRIAGILSNSGFLDAETGSVSFEGVNAQTIPTSAFKNNRIQNLRIYNTSGVTSEAIIEVTGTLKVEAGNFDTGNELSLISNEEQTALIDGSGNGEVTGRVNIQRYLDKAFGYKYFSSPFQNSVVDDFAPYMDFADPTTGFPHFYRYNENRNITINDTLRDATGWEVHTGNLNIAEGYALNFGTTSTPVTIELFGEVNNGPIAAKSLLNHHRTYTKGFHLIGNPYPSPIDWNAVNGWTRTNIDDAIYFFNASDTDQYTGSYTSYVNDVSTGNNATNSSPNIVPSMQGFFVKVSDSETENDVTGTLGMNNQIRIADFNQEFFRASERDLKPLIRLEAGFKTETKNDALVIYFSPYATQNFEKEMDAHKLMNTDPAIPSFYNITEDKKELAINAIPFPESRSYKKIPLGIKADKSGTMKIHLASMENLSPNFNIYLIDHSKSIGQNLSRKPEYTFNIEEGIHNARFELMFSEEKITNPAIAFNEPFHVEVRNGDVIVKLNLEENQEGILRASTITGQILQIKSGVGKDEVIFDGITSSGVYIINLQVGKAQHAKKVVIKK